ncbi:hypothetical protein [Prescottella subtropica]|uniref:hypothetical protein n=1 Tax=Prescottella subtropica TaxID=2545757 RepID=UPI0010F882C6|nr:hypothetical protein [Prescottella subtropica]
MGYDVYSSANLGMPDNDDTRAAIERAATRLIEIPELDELNTTTLESRGALDTVGLALGLALGLDNGMYSDADTWATSADGTIVFYASGEGRHRGLEQVLDILAAEHIDGEITCEGEDYCRWRLRVADGAVHEDSGRIVYDNDPVDDLWIVQMQSVNDDTLDRVTAVRSKAEADTLIARWGREAVAELAAIGYGPAKISPDTSDRDVLDVLARVSGVKWEVYQPTADRQP